MLRKKAKRQTSDEFPDFGNIGEFETLSPEDKEKVARSYADGHHRSEVRPLSAKERTEVKRMQKSPREEHKRMGQPK